MSSDSERVDVASCSLQRLDPEIAEYLAMAPRRLLLSSETLPRIREERVSKPLPVLGDEVERTIVELRGDPSVAITVHRPRGARGRLPCIFLIPGGGYVVPSSSKNYLLRFDGWCTGFPCVGVSIEYCLAPEFPYPAALDDCYAGLRWIYANADSIGVDRERIGLFGGSAGGGLAAGLSLLARDRGEYKLGFQVLIYPMLDDRRVTASSQWQNVPVWPATSNEFGWRAYLGDLFGTVSVPAYAAPARASDLSGLPPTYILVGSLDIFHDEDVAFASCLSHAGVPTDLHVYPGAPHGFDAAECRAGVSMRARRDVDVWLAAHLVTAPDRLAVSEERPDVADG